MKYLLLLLLCLPHLVLATEVIDAEKAKRLKALLDLNIEQLGEVEVKLDDVFDIFDGLLKKQKVKLASGISQNTATAPASTSVITAQDIEAMGARSLEEVLEAVPGLHVSLFQNRFDPLYDVRGIHSANNYEILVMINGIPIKNIINGSRGAWSSPPMQFIQRIEIIRGPGSALYGADAVSGVINIITKTADDIKGTEVGVRMGSFQTYQTWLLNGAQWDGFKTALSLDYLSTDGHQEIIYQDVQSLLDKATGTHVSQAPSPVSLQKRQLNLHGALNTEHWDLNGSWLHIPDIGSGLGGSFVINPEEKQEADQYQLSVQYHHPHLTEHWEGAAQFTYRDIVEDVFNSYSARPGAIRDGEFLPYGDPSNFNFSQQQTRLDLTGQYNGFKNHILRLGVGYLYADLSRVHWSYYLDATKPVMVDVRKFGIMLLPENIRQNSYTFIQDSWKIAPDWELTTGIRYDWYSDFDATTNPRAALVWQTSPNLTTKLLYGSAFRAPSFIEMYSSSNSVLTGNPNLKAETIQNFELAFDYRFDDAVNLTLNLFHYKIKDKILRRMIKQGTSSIYMFDNVGTLEGDGFEIENRWKVSAKSSVLFNYAYAKVKNKAGQEAGDYPHHKVFLRYDWLIGNNWFIDTRLNWVADRERPANDPRPPLQDYTELDLTLRYKDTSKNNHWEFAIGGRNLLDQDRREPGDPRLLGDYPKAGREFFGEVRYRF